MPGGNPVPDTLQIESPDPQPRSSGHSWVAWMGVATIVIALIILMWPGSQRRSSGPHEIRLPFGAAEQAYAPKLQIENLTLSAAENFLHQEITTLAGRVTNTGDQPLADVELTVEFSDQLGQIVLRETRALFASQSSPFSPGERRDFEISFEHIPPSANVQQPAIRISGLQFARK